MMYWLSLLLLAGMASEGGVELSGVAFCERPCDQLFLAVYPLRRPDAPGRVGEPLLVTQVETGKRWKVKVDALPVRVEVSAPGFVTGVIPVWTENDLALPPLWLAKAQAKQVVITGSEKKVLLTTAFEDLEPQKWTWSLPPTWAEREKRLTLPFPESGTVLMQAIGEAGCCGLVTAGAAPEVKMHLNWRPITVTVRDVQGQGVPNVPVAAASAPWGTARVTGAEGKVELYVPTGKGLRVVAWSGERYASSEAKGSQVALALRPSSRLRIIPAKNYLQLAVVPSWLPVALTGGPLALPGSGGELPLGEPAGTLTVWAKGYEKTAVTVSPGQQNVGVRLVPQVAVEGRVLDSRGLPVASAPVWCESGQTSSFGGKRFWGKPSLQREPVWVSGEDGGIGPVLLSAGPLRLWAWKAGLGRGESSLVIGKPGGKLAVDLTLTKGTQVQVLVKDQGGTPLVGAVAELWREP